MAILRKAKYLPDSKLPLAIRKAEVTKATPRDHGHEFTEMVLVTKGSGDQLHASCAYPIVEGDLFVIASGQPHSYTSPRNLEVIVFLFDEPFFVERFPNLPRLSGYQGFFHLAPEARAQHTRMGKIPLSPSSMTDMLRQVEEICAEQETCREGYAIRTTSIFVTMLVDICRAFTEVGTPLNRELRRVGDLLAALEARYEEPWSVPQMAQLIHVSESTLLRSFKRSTGKTPMAWLTDLRLSKARSLLLTSDMTIAAVAAQSGFPDANCFSRVFKARQGMSPSAFRLQVLQ